MLAPPDAPVGGDVDMWCPLCTWPAASYLVGPGIRKPDMLRSRAAATSSRTAARAFAVEVPPSSPQRAARAVPEAAANAAQRATVEGQSS